MIPSTLSASRRAVVALALLAAVAAPLRAQQANASAAAAGLGGNFAARATGANAVAWNPANLGLSGNPGMSLQIGSIGVNAGMRPISLGDIKEFQGVTLPAATREEWMTKITEADGETGSVDLGVGLFGLSLGRFGLQVSTSGYVTPKLNPDASEAILFGNAGRTGTVKDLDLAGSSIAGGAFTTAAASYGMAFGNATGPGASEMAFGITGKYVLGNAVLLARDNGTTTGPNVELDFPIVHVDPDNAGFAGSGIGLDLGFSYRANGATYAVTVMNAMNTFKWDEAKLVFRPGSALFDGENTESDFEEQPFTAAPAVLKTAIADHKFKPTIAFGYSRELAGLTISADARQQLGDSTSVQLGPKTQLGVGAEYKGIPMLPIRGGASYITDGFQLSAGVGIRLGIFELGLAGVMRSVESSTSTGVMVSFVNIR